MTAETDRDRNRRLYGRPRIPRSHRRVMVALLAADGLSGYPLSRLAQVGSGAVYAILARLEALGWAESDFDRREGTGLRRRLYVLTPKGRANVTILLIPAMTVVLMLTPAARRAIESWAAAHEIGAAERDAGVQVTLADVGERRHQLAVRQGLLSEETAAKRAQLLAETAGYDIDREAAGKVLAEAVEGRKRVIAARAEAEAELAPEAARAALSGGENMAELAKAYAGYCEHRPAGARLMGFGEWAGSYAGRGQ